MKIDINNAADFLKNNDNFILICHASPDGDTLGSGYGLCGALHILGKNAKVICDDEPSKRFSFLTNAIEKEKTKFPEVDAKIITIDVADTQLIGSLREKYPNIDLCIDHHISNKLYAKMTLLDETAAACAEVMWLLIKTLVGEETLKASSYGSAIAAAIYTGVSTDTGCFEHSNTTASSHIIAAETLSFGFDISSINFPLFELKTRDRISLEQKALSDLEYHFGTECALVALTADTLKGIDPEDVGSISSLPKRIEGVKIGVVIKERFKDNDENTNNNQRGWKISVRTEHPINAQKICSALGGGGHACAAGCTLIGDIDFVKSSVLKQVELRLHRTIIGHD